MSVLGIDPGMRKAGYALIAQDGSVLARGIEPIDRLSSRIAALVELHAVVALAVGAGTNARKIATELSAFGIPLRLVDERETTLRARRLYYAENPTRLAAPASPGAALPPEADRRLCGRAHRPALPCRPRRRKSRSGVMKPSGISEVV